MTAAVLLASCSQGDPRAPFTSDRLPASLDSRFYPPDGWTWGLIQTSALPPARYGVSAPLGPPRADVLILTSYGEPAELWFETARELNARGYGVWVLEPVGQGGSGRFSRLRDLGYAESLEPDVEAARIMAETVVHRRPLVVIASGASAPAAIQAMAEGLGADGLILTSPELEPAAPDTLARAQAMQRRGLGWIRADLHGGWWRHGPDDVARGLTHDPARGRVRLAWQTADPELRMGSPSWSWLTAFAAAASGAAADEPKLKAPVLVLAPGGADTAAQAAQAACRRTPNCTLQSFGGAGAALQLEADAYRRPWLAAIRGFIEQTIGGFSAPQPESRLSEDG